MKKILIILFSGILLIPVLVLCFVSRKKRIKYWHRFNRDLHTYPALPDNKIDQLFSLCVNFLLLVANLQRNQHLDILHHLAHHHHPLYRTEHRPALLVN